MSGTDLAVTASVALMLAGAVGTTFCRDVTRLVLSLGLFLIGVAMTFLSLGSPLLAASQVFVYVGGVLVLVLFALMMIRRSGAERPRVQSRHDVGAAATAMGVFVVLALVGESAPRVAQSADAAPAAIADSLLGPGLIPFELAGALLLAALLAVLVIVKGARDS